MDRSSAVTGFDLQWEHIHQSRAWGTYPNEHLMRFVFRNFERPYDQYKALDIGCGRGAQSFFLWDQDFDVTGIDGSASAIKRAQEEAETRPTGSMDIEFAVANATAIPFGDNLFDLACEVCCFQHILEPYHLTALHEAHRVLKPGGRFFSLTAKWDHSPSHDTPLRTMRAEEVRREYAATGFRIQSLDQSQFSIHNRAYWVSHWIVSCIKPNGDT